ncbi:hypothetical protein DESAMIL20_746 [Desulfurella amilsii]|uniref:Uncharacterized protein n=1 Tax=Desulfurella amilsii TaxID=1562698 RepID=A0A1X4XUH7_9BACT|nr:hypothetical protein [Desulfurella amilsii]OSS41193.1 hypothetical protein DESAMIL20_746 [Desulfurella amilsii]
MDFTGISQIKLQLDLINLKNLQDLLKIGEVANAKVLEVNGNVATVNIKGSIVKAFSSSVLQSNSTVKLLVTKLEPFVELKILNTNSKEIFNLKNIDTLAQRIFSDVTKFSLENVDEKTFTNYIKTSFENITNAFANSNIPLNENVFIAIPYYINTQKFNLYIKSKKKFTKQQKQRQMITVFSETPIGLLKINIIKIDLIWANLWVYEKSAYNLLITHKEEFKNYTKIPIRIILQEDKPILEKVQSINYIDIVI